MYISIHPLLVKLYNNRARGDKDRKRDPGLNTGIRRQSPRRNYKHRRGFRESEAGPGHRERKTKNRVLAGPRRDGEGEMWGKVS